MPKQTGKPTAETRAAQLETALRNLLGLIDELDAGEHQDDRIDAARVLVGKRSKGTAKARAT